jgi:hypothetical protein
VTDPNNIGQESGQCRRYPPVPYPVPQGQGSMGIITIFPGVNKDMMCGEYQAMIVS